MKPWMPAALRPCARSSISTRQALCNTFILPLRSATRSRTFTVASCKAQPIRSPATPPIDAHEHDSEVDEQIQNLPNEPHQRSIQAADEIEFKEGIVGDELPVEEEDPSALPDIVARLVPASPSYFTGAPIFIDNLLSLQTVLRKYATIPTVKQPPRVSWRSVVDYRNMIGEGVGNARYTKIIQILRRLNQINPALMPTEVAATIAAYKKDINPLENKAKPITIDRFGRALGIGRRKASTARAWLVEGSGEVLINGKTLTQAFGRVHDRESVLWALKSTSRIDKYNLWALVEGGGTTGQAEALTLAVAKALLAHEPLLKQALRRAGVVTRDPRRVERKKPGHLKARKKPTWVKR